MPEEKLQQNEKKYKKDDVRQPRPSATGVNQKLKNTQKCRKGERALGVLLSL